MLNVPAQSLPERRTPGVGALAISVNGQCPQYPASGSQAVRRGLDVGIAVVAAIAPDGRPIVPGGIAANVINRRYGRMRLGVTLANEVEWSGFRSAHPLTSGVPCRCRGRGDYAVP